MQQEVAGLETQLEEHRERKSTLRDTLITANALPPKNENVPKRRLS